MHNTFASVVTAEKITTKIRFRTLVSNVQVEQSDCVLPMEHVTAAQNKFANSLVGFFLGKSVAFTLVQNYVSNTWGKFGFQKVIRDDDGVFFSSFRRLRVWSRYWRRVLG